MRHVVASLVKLVLVGTVAGCTSSPPREMPPPSILPIQGGRPVSLPFSPPRHEVVVFPTAAASHDLDLLFLVDDSPSMADKQANVGDAVATLVEGLNLLPGGLPNLHIGVATSDMGTQGALDMNPNFGPTIGAGLPGACSGVGKDGVMQLFGQPVNGAFLSDIADPMTGVRVRNYTGDLATVFGNIVRGAGARGCGFEQHLAAVSRALTNPANQGFLRQDASLGVIIVADEDDCSLAHYSLLATDANATATLGELQSFRCTRFGVQCDQGGQTPDAMNMIGLKARCHPSDSSPYLATISNAAAFLNGLKADPAKIAVAAIAGTIDRFAVELRAPVGEKAAIPALAHACTYVDRNGMTEVADPSIRFQAFLDQFPHRSTSATICEQDLSGAMQQISELLQTTMGGVPCFSGPLADSDPKTPGMQYDCTVTAAATADASTGTALPRCTPEDGSATNQPCWHIAVDATHCPSGDHLTPVIEGRSSLAQAGSYVTASCIAPTM